MVRNKALCAALAVAFSANLILFFVKLYIGLRTNSISIYSDAVNNLFDSLSGLITLIFMSVIIKRSGSSSGKTVEKGEQLFSMLISITVTLAGLGFGYTAFERLMYPTPVWFTYGYAFMLAGTAAAKMILYFVYDIFFKKSHSPVIKVMRYDCILDFFITAVTVVTLIVSKFGLYALDAVAGIIISAAMVITAVKLVISSGKLLVNYVSPETREILTGLLPDSVRIVTFETTSSGITAFLSGELPQEDLSALRRECLEKAGVEIFTVKGE